MRTTSSIFIKKIYVMFLCLVLINTLQADEDDDFRLLNPEQQIQKLIDDYRYNNARGGLNYRFLHLINIISENPEAVKPVAFSFFENINPPKYPATADPSFDIILNIIYYKFYGEGLLNREEELRLAALFQQKLDYYLRTYKVLDGIPIMFEVTIINIKTGENIRDIPDYARNIWRKYRDLGYEDLEFNYYPYGKR